MKHEVEVEDLIDPVKAAFYYHPAEDGKPGTVIVCEKWKYPKSDKRYHCLGGVLAGWKRLNGDEFYHAMDFLAMEISEFAGVPIGELRNEMEKVRGYKEHSDKWGRMAMTGKPT